MEPSKEFKEIKERISAKKLDTDWVKMEQGHREIKTELMLKRNQVEQLKKDLDTANLTIFDLKRTLENSMSSLRDSEFNLKLALKKASNAEERFNEIKDSYMKMKLREEMRTNEMTIQNDTLQQVAGEKDKLSRELEDVKNNLEYYVAFQSEMEDRQGTINTLITRIQDSVAKLETEHSSIKDLEQRLQSLDEWKKSTELLLQRSDALKERIRVLESTNIKGCAKLEQLTQLMQHNPPSTTQLHRGYTAGSEIREIYMEKCLSTLQQESLTKDEIIKRITEALDKELTTNAELIMKEEESENTIKGLLDKLANVQQAVEMQQVKLKTEVVEID